MDITWHSTKITRADREKRNGHKGACLWFTGLSGSGKSTLANEVEAVLFAGGAHTYLLDGDNVRHGLNFNLDFSEEGRRENIRRVGEVAKLFVDAGIIVLTAFISPFRRDRDNVRYLLETGRFIEIFIDCDLATCEARDPKGLYKKTRDGKIADFTGISSPYEEPPSPEIRVFNGAGAQLDDNVRTIVQYIEKAGITGPR